MNQMKSQPRTHEGEHVETKPDGREGSERDMFSTRPSARPERERTVTPITPPAASGDIVHVDPRVYDIVRRVLAGEMKAITVTPDMVGMRIASSEELFMLPPDMDAPADDRPSRNRNVHIKELLLEELSQSRERGEGAMSLDGLSRSFVDLEVYKNDASARSSLMNRLRKMQDEGAVKITIVGKTRMIEAV